MSTLGEIHGLDFAQVELRQLSRAPGMKHLHIHHPDIVELDLETANEFSDPTKVYKQHIPPTKNNIDILGRQPIVVLLRDPDDVLDAYHRAFRSYAMSSNGVDRRLSRQGWRQHAESVGLADDIRLFHHGWTAADHEDLIVVGFDDLVADPKNVLNAVERHFGLPETVTDIELRKDRYTRSATFTAKRAAGKWSRHLGVYDMLDDLSTRLGLR
jgi:hypothetical protein